MNCPELRSWAIIPRLGEQSSFAIYDAPDGKRSEITTLEAVRSVQVHTIEGVEIAVRVWKPGTRWLRPGALFARLNDERAEYLAVHLPHEDMTQFETFRDEDFAWNWGTLYCPVPDTGPLVRQSDSTFRLSSGTSPLPEGSVIGCGVVRLEIGDQAFTCQRVFELSEIEGLSDDSTTTLTEGFLTQEGRTLLLRRYCRPRFAEIAAMPIVLDESESITADGKAFFHWYDTLTNLAVLGTSPL